MKSKIPKIIAGDFLERIDKAIKEGRHVDYLQNVLKEYEYYQQFFKKVLLDKNKHGLYLFKVDYLLKKPVWREIVILAEQTLERLAEAIIESMEWEKDHMHGFGFLQREDKKSNIHTTNYMIYAPDWEDDPFPTYKTDQIKIGQINWQTDSKIQFIFDFGDNHIFDIKFLRILPVTKSETTDDYPQVIDLIGVAPEQYPYFEDASEEDFPDDHDLFSDDCELCRELKSKGVKMQWFPDSPPRKKIIS